MNDVTQILSQIEAGQPGAADELLSLVYQELHRLASHKMALEKPGQTLDTTALVHEVATFGASSYSISQLRLPMTNC